MPDQTQDLSDAVLARLECAASVLAGAHGPAELYLATDSPFVVALARQALGAKYRLIVYDDPVRHVADPEAEPSDRLRMLVDWFAFAHADFALLTYPSSFASSAWLGTRRVGSHHADGCELSSWDATKSWWPTDPTQPSEKSPGLHMLLAGPIEPGQVRVIGGHTVKLKPIPPL